MTNDIDLLLADTGPGLDELEKNIVRAGWSVYRADPGGELLRLKHAEYGVADLLIAGTEYQQQAIHRAVRETIENGNVKVLAVEDVIVHKLIAGRYQDLADIEAIIDSMVTFDYDYIEQWAKFWELGDLWEQLKP